MNRTGRLRSRKQSRAERANRELERREYEHRKQVPGDGRRAPGRWRDSEPALVAEQIEPAGPPPEPSRGRSQRRRFQLRRGVQQRRFRRPGEGRRCGDDRLAGLVAGGLRPLRSALHPHDVARRGHLPYRRRARRRGLRRPALRASQQLARQCEPRQGAPAALAGQAEIRPQDLMGRPADLRREPRPGDDGLQDLRLRRRPRRHLGGRRGHLLGSGTGLARRRALQRRPRAGRSARRRPDGPDLRQPAGAERQPRPGGGGPRHSRDLPPYGDERRGNGGAYCRRPHLRQGPRCRRREVQGARARGRRPRAAGLRLDEQPWQRQGRRPDRQRARGRLDQRSGQVGQRLFRQPVQL